MQSRISYVKTKCLYSLRMAVCSVTLQSSNLNPSSIAAVLHNQAGYQPPVSDEKKSMFYAAHFPPPSMLPRSPTPSPVVELPSKSPAPLSREPHVLPTSAGNRMMSSTSASINEPTFDKLPFFKYVKNIGRPYRKRAVELVSISRTFMQAQSLKLTYRDSDLRR